MRRIAFITGIIAGDECSEWKSRDVVWNDVPRWVMISNRTIELPSLELLYSEGNSIQYYDLVDLRSIVGSNVIS